MKPCILAASWSCATPFRGPAVMKMCKCAAFSNCKESFTPPAKCATLTQKTTTLKMAPCPQTLLLMQTNVPCTGKDSFSTFQHVHQHVSSQRWQHKVAQMRDNGQNSLSFEFDIERNHFIKTHLSKLADSYRMTREALHFLDFRGFAATACDSRPVVLL